MPYEPAGPPPLPTDLDLIRRIALARDADALAELYHRHGHAMSGIARRVSRHHVLSEDAVQEALVQIWREAERYDPSRGSVQSWLFVITRARTLDRMRAERVRSAWKGTTASQSASCQATAERALIARQTMAEIRSVLDVLPDTDRLPLSLACFDGLTHAELSRRLNLPLGTVKTRLRRGFAVLRAVTQQERRPFRWVPPAPPPRNALSGRHVLVVDDEKETLTLARLVLQSAGALVKTAACAEDAVSLARDARFDVLVADLDMPGQDGCALLADIHRLPRVMRQHVVTVAFTGLTRDQDRRRARRAGFDLYLAKPMRPAALVSALNDVIDRAAVVPSAFVRVEP